LLNWACCSQEDLENLFSAVRDIATTKNDQEDNAEKVKQLIDGLRMNVYQGSSGKHIAHTSKRRGKPALSEQPSSGSSEQQLHSELVSASRLLQQQINKRRM
jgi:hypothetical protein